MSDGDGDGDEALSGGRMTAGVVRIGATVRQPRSAASEFTAVLLAEFAAAGFDGAPRRLGWDEAGRDFLSFLPGEVPAKWRAWTDDQVAAAGVLLRRMHDATRDLARRLARNEDFWSGAKGPAPAEMVAWTRRERAWVTRSREVFEDAL
ncbi:hypothetical protein [Symbioplanes lichenis]|uniref:hypothetical protein n=1 Tax=Symbioplanes lichenis TaxID=1629072 RepID=UPI00273A2B5F|nr:hypothetical protein [Actinoplanes lichenis]